MKLYLEDLENQLTTAKEKFESKKLPMMPIRDVVIFPHMMTPFVVGRESSVRALEEALAADKKIFLSTQHDASIDEPKPNEIYQVGTIVNIVQSLKLPDGNIKVLVEGIERGKILQIIETEGFMQASVRVARYATETTQQIEAAGMPKEVRDKAIQELKKLEAMPPMSAESTVSRNYLDWLLAVPWKKRSKEIRNISRAEKVLNEDHYGLEKIKERILEFLAVRQLVKNPKGSILCFVGPPGVGKTSLGMSIAKATGRKFVRMSLGGVRDEAEVRGHRRTYIGALPGQIIQMMKKAGTKNPVFMLDEVDKMSMDFRGDPSSALLEVLDPEQNYMFVDHYLDVEYDLSQVFFIATANVMHTIPPALQDRMEVIRLSGYTELEKLEIAKRFLVKKQMEQTGLSEKDIQFMDEGLAALAQGFMHDAGGRNVGVGCGK